jgi:hypothetical protein
VRSGRRGSPTIPESVAHAKTLDMQDFIFCHCFLIPGPTNITVSISTSLEFTLDGNFGAWGELAMSQDVTRPEEGIIAHEGFLATCSAAYHPKPLQKERAY